MADMVNPAALAGARMNSLQWHQMVSSAFGELDLNLGDDDRFSGSVKQASFDVIAVARASSACEDAVRTVRHVTTDKREDYVLVMPLSGTLRISQRGRSCELDSRHYALFDLNAPHRYTHAGSLVALSMRAPARMLRASVRRVDDMVATTLPADHGVARITRDFVGSILRETTPLDARVATRLGNRLADMATLMLDCTSPDVPEQSSAIRQVIHQRCIRIIDARLHDPDLKPEVVAMACGISTRYLHKVVQHSGETLVEYIRNRRLDLCREQLERLEQNGQIKGVALSAGFRSLSHFSNAFKARFGMKPTDARRGRLGS